MYVKITNGNPVKYTIGEFRRDNPQVSFPKIIPESTLVEYGVYPLATSERPSCDPITQNLVEGTPKLVEGVWTQTWGVVGISLEEVEQRKATRLARLKQQRSSAYTQEADPLFFKAQRGEVTIAEWEAKVLEIKTRYPYPAY